MAALLSAIAIAVWIVQAASTGIKPSRSAQLLCFIVAFTLVYPAAMMLEKSLHTPRIERK